MLYDIEIVYQFWCMYLKGGWNNLKSHLLRTHLIRSEKTESNEKDLIGWKVYLNQISAHICHSQTYHQKESAREEELDAWTSKAAASSYNINIWCKQTRI